LTLAALGTAFYMSRLYYLIFSGECRADEQIQSHIHESPKSMTGPLVVLAGFTLVIGFLGLPHIGSLPNMFGEWLEPSLKSDVVPKLSAGWTMLLLGIATAVALFGIFLGRLYYRGGVSATVTSFTHGFGRGLHDLSLNKFYVDEAYEKYILGPFRWTARMLFEVIDRFLIDVLIVNGVGFVMATSGRIAGWYQNGQIQRYLVGLLVGAALVFYFAQDAPIDFDYEQVNPTADSADLERDWLRPVIKFHGDIGAGPSSVGAVIGWDFNADGRYDSTSLDPTWVFSRPGEYPVTLWVIDGVFGGKSEITKTITVRPRLGGVPVEKVPNE